MSPCVCVFLVEHAANARALDDVSSSLAGSSLFARVGKTAGRGRRGPRRRGRQRVVDGVVDGGRGTPPPHAHDAIHPRVRRPHLFFTPRLLFTPRLSLPEMLGTTTCPKLSQMSQTFPTFPNPPRTKGIRSRLVPTRSSSRELAPCFGMQPPSSRVPRCAPLVRFEPRWYQRPFLVPLVRVL